MAEAKQTHARRTATKSAAKKTTAHATKGASSKRSHGSVSAADKDAKGGLNAEGRKEYNEQTGGHLRPDVKHPAKTTEEKQRKGSFLRRHFTTPQGPVVKDGEPSRQALQAAAWGEPVPHSKADEKKLAAKGKKLLEEAKAEKAAKER